MTAVLALIPRWVLAALAAVFLVVAGVLAFKLASARSDLATARIETADLRIAISAADAKAAQQSRDLTTAVLKAEHEAKTRETEIRIAAAAAATESDGLRDDLAAMRVQLGELSREAAVERAAAIGVVLSQCAARHQELAQRCDRHANDVRTLIDAWPH